MIGHYKLGVIAAFGVELRKELIIGPYKYDRNISCTSVIRYQVILMMNYSGSTPPPNDEVDLNELYRRHPQLWQGFVAIKKHAAMVQLHYLNGSKLLGI